MIQSLVNRQFRQVYEQGRSLSDRYLVMYILPNGLEINRLGISVSKKNGNSVVRSRLKRIIKEAYRLLQPQLVPGYDIVFIARNPSIGEKSTRMALSIHRLSQRFHLLKEKNEES